MPGRKRKRSSVVASSSNRSNKKQTAGKRSLEGTKEEDKKTATAPSLSPLDPTIEAVPRLIVLGGQQTVVSVNGSVEVGGRTWTVQQANPSKLVLICDRLEDEDEEKKSQLVVKWPTGSSLNYSWMKHLLPAALQTELERLQKRHLALRFQTATKGIDAVTFNGPKKVVNDCKNSIETWLLQKRSELEGLSESLALTSR
mmetsp:Transcript_3132/g.4404  ORF Transcript_3132/g.4404 Transcript_3132/m.4404 type:complete len:199 (+) Transcript_3132:26-622(+)